MQGVIWQIPTTLKQENNDDGTQLLNSTICKNTE